jgi:hypothetical protein
VNNARSRVRWGGESSSMRRSCRRARARVGPMLPSGMPAVRATSALVRAWSVNNACNRIR